MLHATFHSEASHQQPRCISIKFHNHESMQLLIKHKAKINVEARLTFNRALNEEPHSLLSGKGSLFLKKRPCVKGVFLPPLHFAAFASSPDAVRVLCQTGGDLQIKNSFGLSALHSAAMSSTQRGRDGLDETRRFELERKSTSSSQSCKSRSSITLFC